MNESVKEEKVDENSGIVWAVIFSFIIAFAIGFITALVCVKNSNIVTV